MSTFPEQLRDLKFRFVRIKKGEKRPIDDGWTFDNNFQFDSQTLKEWMDNGQNYGVVGGFGNLLIIDADTPEISDACFEKLPTTFTVQSGSGRGHHFYFVCNDLEGSIRLKDKENKNIGDIQIKGKQVVGPTSIHPSGGKYEVVRNFPIAEVQSEQLRFAFSEWLVKSKPVTFNAQLQKHGINENEIPLENMIDFSKMKEHGRGELCGDHPIHGSTTGMNFWANPEKGLWHCFRHDTGGNFFSWIAVKHGIIKCEEALPGALKGTKFTEVLTIAKNEYGLKIKALEADLILDDKQLKEEVTFELLKREPKMASELLVVRILNDLKIYTLRSDERPEMWVYEDGIYVPNGKTRIYEFVSSVVGKAFTTPFANLIVDKIKVRTYISPEDFFGRELINEIAVENGVLNIFTRELSDFTPDKFFFSKIPVHFDVSARCPAIHEHFRAILKTETDVPILEELFGFLLLKEYQFEKAFMFIGNGRNGKGKTLELMKRFLGPENVSSIPIQQFESDNYAAGELHKKLANLAGDIGRTALKTTGMFKTLTGRDFISAGRKYLTRLNFTNYAKLIFAANELPLSYDLSVAFFERWILLEFPFTFVSQEVFSNATEEESRMLKLIDTSIIDKISKPDQLSGLLNVALDGLSRLLDNKGFSYSKSRQEVEKMWLRKSSSLLGFIQDFVEEDFDSYVTKKDFRNAYTMYCRKHKLRGISDKLLADILPLNLSVSSERKKIGDNQVGIWDGIRLKVVSLNKEEALKRVDEGWK